MNKNLIYTILVLILFSCKSEKEKAFDIITNSFGKEWRLDKLKGKNPANYHVRYFLIFHEDFTYEIFNKKNGKILPKEWSDNIYYYEWSIDEKGYLDINIFDDMEPTTLDFNYLSFTRKKVKYEFICESCEKI